MSRWEFMRQLEELLFDISPSEREEALQYYNDYFNDAGRENEQAVIEALGTPAQVAAIVREGLQENGSIGEFTENGFYQGSGGRATVVNEVVKGEQSAEGAADTTGSAGVNGTAGAAAAGTGETAGATAAGTCETAGATAAGTGGATGAAAAGTGEIARATAAGMGGAAGATAAGMGGTTGATAAGMSGAAAADENGRTGQGKAVRNGSTESPKGSTEAKKGMPAWAIILIVIACILCSPAILGLGAVILGVLFSLVAAAAALIFGLGLTTVILFIVAIALVGAGFGCLLAAPIEAIGLIGGGLICAAIGMIFLLLTVLLVGKCIPGICQGIAYICRKLFGKKGGAKA